MSISTNLGVEPGNRQLTCPVWGFPMLDTLRDALFFFHAVGVDLGLLADHVCGLQVPVSCVRAVGGRRRIAKESRGN